MSDAKLPSHRELPKSVPAFSQGIHVEKKNTGETNPPTTEPMADGHYLVLLPTTKAWSHLLLLLLPGFGALGGCRIVKSGVQKFGDCRVYVSVGFWVAIFGLRNDWLVLKCFNFVSSIGTGR